MLKRVVDLFLSILLLTVLLPVFLLISLSILFSSKGPVFYRQVRVGKDNCDFRIFKFRTMFLDSDKKGLLTVGGRDPRVTPVGYYLRRFKLDELPQLLNVLVGDMSLVGPRPEVRRYVDLYDARQQQVLSIRPGITDWASIEYSNENEILAKAADPEQTYIQEIMPAKLELNLVYIQKQGLITDLGIMTKTFLKIIGVN